MTTSNVDDTSSLAEGQEAFHLNHVMRWRLGVQDQSMRVEERAAEYRRAAASVPPGLAPSGSSLEANWTLAEQWRLRNEVHFLLIAVRNAMRFSEGLQALHGDPDVRTAIVEFQKAQPNADLLRNVHEHVDEYMAGGGRQRGRFPQSPTVGSIDVRGDDVVYEIGGIEFSIRATVGAALELTERVIRATQRRLYRV